MRRGPPCPCPTKPGFSSPASLKSAVNRLNSINSKWWWHEIGLEDHDNWTGRDQLAAVLRHASTRYPSFCYQEQAYGAHATFQLNRSETKTRQPRYFLIGDKSTTDGRKMTMASQNKLLCAIQGGKGARLKDASTIQRRQEGWKDSVEKKINFSLPCFPRTRVSCHSIGIRTVV